MVDKETENQINRLIQKQLKHEYRLEKPTFKEETADIVAEFGGSWSFILGFSIFFITWIALNVYWLHFDEYPFILLNLILSCLAVFQAPFILMSQNRMADIDRKRDERAYKVALKAELEIKMLDEKLDKIMNQLGIANTYHK